MQDSQPGERRKLSYSLRRDLNDLIRSPDGKVSAGKVWANVGQWIAAYLLLHHSEFIIDRWDAMVVLFVALLSPELLKSVIKGKYGATADTVEQQMGLDRANAGRIRAEFDNPDQSPGTRRNR